MIPLYQAPNLFNLLPRGLFASDRQYLGIVLGGRRVVYINAFWSAEGRPDWLVKPVTTCDGGNGYWGAVYDPETGRFSRLGFNGEG